MPSNSPYSIKIIHGNDLSSTTVLIEVYSSQPVNQEEFDWLMQELTKHLEVREIPFKTNHPGTLALLICKNEFKDIKESMMGTLRFLCLQGYFLKGNVDAFNQQANEIIASMSEEAAQDSEANFKFMP